MMDRLKTEIERTISQYCDEPLHRDAVLRALARPGFALHPSARCRAGALALEIYRAIRGQPSDAAWLAAAAVELYLEAGFLFDDVADQEVDPGLDSSGPEELALAITMMNCGVAAAYDAARRAEASPDALLSVQRLVRDCITACGGQFLDASLSRQDVATTEEALRMTELKAGGCGKLAASFAAEIATDDEELISLFRDFGFNLFTYLQLVDDLRDAGPAQGTFSDMALRKMTVPLVYFYSSLNAERLDAANGIMPARIGAEPGHDYAPVFEASGASVFGAVVAEAYLNLARADLAGLSNRLGTLDNLERLIDTLELRPQEIVAAS